MDRDRTGPEGKGPMTGRGRGFCINFEIPEMEFTESNMNLKGDFQREFHRGFGRGFGKGFQFRIQPQEVTKEDRVEYLKKQKKFFEEKALGIGKQLKDFDKPLKGIKKPVKMKVEKKVRGKK